MRGEEGGKKVSPPLRFASPFNHRRKPGSRSKLLQITLVSKPCVAMTFDLIKDFPYEDIKMLR